MSEPVEHQLAETPSHAQSTNISTRDRVAVLDIEEASRSRVTRFDLSYSELDSLGPKIAELYLILSSYIMKREIYPLEDLLDIFPLFRFNYVVTFIYH